MRLGVFGGYSESNGDIVGTPQGGGIPYDGGGGFGGVFISGELTSPSPPRKSFISRTLRPDPVVVVAPPDKPKPKPEPPVDPLAKYGALGAALLALGGIVKSIPLFLAKIPNSNRP